MSLNIEFTAEHIICNGKKFNRTFIDRIIKLASDPAIKHVVDDGFCGMGGVTAGFSQLPGWMVISCINHWSVAIETHEKNHPDCLHLLEDFRFADITILQYMHQEIKRNNPGVKFHLWLSLECTNFSNAKGGMSRDADSRTLADYADRYVIALNPDVIWIENVKEFRLWGPMIPKTIIGSGKKKQTLQFNPEIDDAEVFFKYVIAKGLAPQCPLLVNKKKKTIAPWTIPEKARQGEDFQRWKKHICSFGYDSKVGERLLNCADYGIPQHRIRLIMQFNRIGMSAYYPKPTHDKKARNGLQLWNPVKPCLDLADEGESVLSFKIAKGKRNKGELVPRITSSKTIDRLINGTDKHVLKAKQDTWIVKPNSAKNNTDVSAGASIEDPSATITCFNGLNVAKAYLVDHYFGNGYMNPVTVPAGTTGTKDGAALHTLKFLSTYHSQGNGSSVDNPSPAIMTKDKYPVVSATFIDQQFTSGQKNKSVAEPSGALLANPKQKLVKVDRFIMDTQFDNGGKSVDKPSGTITANRKHYYIVNFQWFNAGITPISQPSNTIIARQDKSPNYLITLETGELAIEVFKHDPPHYVKLKKYMAANGIIAINMRMLKEIEMLRIMTIPENTKMSKSSTNNKKMIGNAVPSDLIVHLGRTYAEEWDWYDLLYN
jgi:DNA (cytosine-5)-methyltransferase 1